MDEVRARREAESQAEPGGPPPPPKPGGGTLSAKEQELEQLQALGAALDQQLRLQDPRHPSYDAWHKDYQVFH